MTAARGTAFHSPKTVEALQFVGFSAKYGTLEGSQWSYSPNMLSRLEAVDATARLSNIYLLQVLFPEWRSELVDADIGELIDAIERTHGPLDQNAIARAASAV